MWLSSLFKIAFTQLIIMQLVLPSAVVGGSVVLWCHVSSHFGVHFDATSHGLEHDHQYNLY